MDVIKSISLKLTVDFGWGICAGRLFFFCDPPFAIGMGGGLAYVGATFDSFTMACTIGFCDSRYAAS
jgi:hypothetical protein